MLLKLQTPNLLNYELEKTIKAAERYQEKLREKKNTVHDPEHDGFDGEKLLRVYDAMVEKLSRPPFAKLPGNPVDQLIAGRATFAALEISKQVQALLQVVSVLKTGRAGSCDLSFVGAASRSANLILSAMLKNAYKNYSSVMIVDTSASGLYERKSENLAELL